MIDIIIGLVAACIGIAAGYLYSRMRGRTQADSDENRARTLLEHARQQAEAVKKESELQARAEVIKAREEFERSVDARRKEMSALEERINQRELNVERKVALIDKKEKTIEDKLAEIEKHIAEVAVEKESLRKLINEERDKLQKIAGLSQDEARKILMQRLEKEMHAEFGALIRKTQEDAKEIASRDARNILVSAVQRCAASHASELMTSTVTLPSDDMKGRIIGRDGRNIRSIEALTGVSVLIDDTPEAVVVSGFDPIRREIAKQSMEQLVADGRIHPGRIEEIVAKVTEHMEETIRCPGNTAGSHAYDRQAEIPHQFHAECSVPFTRSVLSAWPYGR
jgi:ribonucrease Y